MSKQQKQDQDAKKTQSDPDEKSTKTKEEVVDPAELMATLQRVQADFANYKRRTEGERADFVKYAGEAVLRELLPILDSLELAKKNLPEDLANNEWAKGVVAMEGQLREILHRLGVERIECVGESCDPAQHEVLLMVEGNPDTVVAELEPGYRLHDRVLRAAKVSVGKKGE